MKFFYCPGACSIGIHVLLEEIGKPYEGHKVALAEGEQYKPDYLAINPKSKVPTLVRDDGTTLTEFGAIAAWLARTNKDAHLLPDDLETEIRIVEALDFCVGTIHMQGFSRMFRPAAFAPSEADHEAVRARGREIVEKGFKVMSDTLGTKTYVAGDFSIADGALFYVEFWAGHLGAALPPALAAHLDRMMARPAVQRVLKDEGFAK